ncbi:MAG: hypothetical protein PHH51_03305 [Bacilli bacterium]|nr:hypothetical protein [Bacilli bacterium]MDD3896096.1 hypothetical protein [Bacilli bacterium]
MEKEILFDSLEQKEATERVLAAVRIKTIGKELFALNNEIVIYASNIDKILERNNLKPRYLEKIGILDNISNVTLDDDLFNIDFRVKEVVEDLIKRINTRINLVKNNEVLINELTETYKIDEQKISEDINIAKLNKNDFDELIEI